MNCNSLKQSNKKYKANLSLQVVSIIFLFIVLINPLFSKSEVGITTSYNVYLPSQSLSSLQRTFYYYYQIQIVHWFFYNQQNTQQNFEIYFLIYSIIDKDDFLGLHLGSSSLPKIQSYYFTYNEETISKWNGNFNFFLFQYGRIIPYKVFLKKSFIEIYGGVGFLHNFQLKLKTAELSPNNFSEPFFFKQGSFLNNEGYLTRLGINFGTSYRQAKFRLGIAFQYTLVELSRGKIFSESTRLFLFNKNKVWISQDITFYQKNKEIYESLNLNILYEYPRIKSYSLTFGTTHIFFSIGINI